MVWYLALAFFASLVLGPVIAGAIALAAGFYNEERAAGAVSSPKAVARTLRRFAPLVLFVVVLAPIPIGGTIALFWGLRHIAQHAGFGGVWAALAAIGG